jgi:hypothetical protein
VAHRTVVAGLVAAEGVVRATGFNEDGAADWSADVLRGVVWGTDADLRLFPAGDGVALVWRGPRDGSTARTLAVVGPRGEARGEPIEIGPAYCATAEGLAWIDGRPGEAARVRAVRWGDATVRDVVAVPKDRDPGLVCGDRAVLVLGDGDDDLTTTSFVPGESSPPRPVVALRDADFGDDEEREHQAYSVGDDLGIVRVGASGAVWLREVLHDGTLTPWRRLKHAVGEDDDVVAVDGDADGTVVVFAREEEDACPDPGSSAVSVRALRFERKTGAESRLDLAAASCDVAPGPFWVAFPPSGAAVTWIERGARLAQGAAPIVGISWHSVAMADAAPPHLEISADAVVDAGCDDQGCAVAALLREPGGDGMHPAAIRVFRYL